MNRGLVSNQYRMPLRELGSAANSRAPGAPYNLLPFFLAF